ncbi:unnamed protein product [Vicia faba]|uniref:Uncharacterized protein n=1 Tax=Vicia faba TaxID=3906 RepID=A0AAV1AWX6_VICFA|nr:unnamed protein product [Vicia faba]
MHIEKNFFDNVFNTVMDVKDRTKDNVKARQDMEILCNRKELELKPQLNGKLFKPKAYFSLTPKEAKAVYGWLKGLRIPDGHSSNLARCVDANTGKLHGMCCTPNFDLRYHLPSTSLHCKCFDLSLSIFKAVF